MGRGRASLILVVDDNADLRMTFAEILWQHGYEVREASEPSEALRIARDDRVDLVLQDLLLSGEASTELYESLARLDPPPRIVMMTAYPVSAVSERHLRRYAAALLHKPFRPDLLLQVIADVLGEDPERSAPEP